MPSFKTYFAESRETSYHFVKNFFPSRTVSDDPEDRTCETWETPRARGRPYASHQMKRTISRGELRIKARKTFFIFNGNQREKTFPPGSLDAPPAPSGARQKASLHGRKGHPMLYIAATVEDLSAYEGLKCFSKSALAAMIDWYDEQEIDQEADAAELRGEWTEYESAGEMWHDFRELDDALPIIYDPDQLESLTDAMEAQGFNIVRTESGSWLVHEA